MIRLDDRCPLVAITKRHRGPIIPRTGWACCAPIKPPRAFDHTYAVRRGTDRGFLAMPFDWERKEVELQRWCNRWDLNLHVLGEGWWSPASTAVLLTDRSTS